MRALLSLTLLAGLAISPQALAAPLGGEVRRVAQRFNAVASEEGLSMRLSLSKCGSGARTVCTYSGGDDLGLLASGEGESKPLEDMMLIFGGKDADPLKFLQTMIILMAIYAPNAEPAERGVVLKALTNQMKNSKYEALFLHGVSFKATKIEGFPLMVSVTRP